jgi:hypothetical protein
MSIVENLFNTWNSYACLQFALRRRQAMYALYISFEFSVTPWYIGERGVENIVTHMTIARRRLGKQSLCYVLNNRRTSISRQRSGKHPYELLRDGIFHGVHSETI